MVSHTTTVGKRGEILPKKTLRQAAGLQPGDTVQLEAREGQITIRKVHSPAEILARKPVTRSTPRDLEAELDEEGRHQETMVN